MLQHSCNVVALVGVLFSWVCMNLQTEFGTEAHFRLQGPVFVTTPMQIKFVSSLFGISMWWKSFSSSGRIFRLIFSIKCHIGCGPIYCDHIVNWTWYIYFAGVVFESFSFWSKHLTVHSLHSSPLTSSIVTEVLYRAT